MHCDEITEVVSHLFLACFRSCLGLLYFVAHVRNDDACGVRDNGRASTAERGWSDIILGDNEHPTCLSITSS